MPSNITVELVDGVRVVVPDSLNLITSYVLREQNDWFEDEIKFLRHLIQPGQRVIDIGANCGVYTLTMAKLVGPTGRVWAFEPASATANLLAAGITANEFANVELIRSAVSNVPGTAQLSLHENSELNELVRDATAPGGATETVSCVTVDDSRDIHGWKDIDFWKIDAEGEEVNIVRGGASFLAAESPLIQYEINASGAVNLDLVWEFVEHGYQSYRLVPGLGVLVPFDIQEARDSHLLNLFCCKPERAARLAAQGFLLEASSITAAKRQLDIRSSSSGKPDWRTALVKLPYGALLSAQWAQQMTGDQSRAVAAPLLQYALSRDSALPMAERFAALEASHRGFEQLCATDPAHLRLCSLARTAQDYGARGAAGAALNELCNRVLQEGQVSTVEPFLAPGPRFDSISPGDLQSVARWVAAAVFEELERQQYFSSFYTGTATVRRLEMIRDLGFGSDEMKRRLQLIKQRFGT